MNKNRVKPTDKQLKTLRHLSNAKTLQEAMLKGGYSKASSINPKVNFIDREGTKSAIQEYKEHLINAGASPEILAEIEVAGLFEENGAVRLGYLKEVKKSFGLAEPDPGNIKRQVIATEFFQSGENGEEDEK
jgi:hypothetical protein